MRIEVLDHGYVEYIEGWGCGKGSDSLLVDYEAGIIEAARQSTQGSFRGWEQDEKLLKYLYDNEHATPFEFSGCVLEVQAPIFVFREWHRHRTQSYNEMSARYAPLPDLYYEPSLEAVEERAATASRNRQAGVIAAYKASQVVAWWDRMVRFYKDAEELYQYGLDAGVPKELARITMPVGHYSRMRASANLRNWLAFMDLRDSILAQWEIRQYAKALGQVLDEYFPRTMALYRAEPH